MARLWERTNCTLVIFACIMLKNGQTYFESLAIFQHYENTNQMLICLRRPELSPFTINGQ